MNHDEHYRTAEIEPIIIMEDIITRLPIEPKARLCVAMAAKHMMRAGKKANEPWEKEIEKAKNYLHRALTGKWQ